MALAESLSLLYRGPLSSCNYACPYCPFAKRAESAAEREADRRALERFVGWVAGRVGPTRVFFTPWGEALVCERYRRAVVRLSRLPQVERVAVQTNLSTSPVWLEAADTATVALWATYHPGQVARHRFLERCARLGELGVRFSVGAVGLREHLGEIEAVRAALPGHVYMWVNAYDRRGPGYYSDTDLRRLGAVDPLFALNLRRYRSRGRACRTGHTVVAVSGDGTARRCHFVEAPIGNLYDPDFEAALRPRPCPRALCDCHIGYTHMNELAPGGPDPYALFGDGVLERIPDGFGWPG